MPKTYLLLIWNFPFWSSQHFSASIRTFLFCLTFGPVVAAYLLQFLVSKVWYAQTDAAVVLATYACYIPFLAMNGALEAFVQSVATPADIKHQSSVMLIFSLSFSAAACLLMRPLGLGAQGLVLANMFNMAQRIGWCLMWIESYYKKLRENSDDIAKAAVEIKQELSEEKKKEELITKKRKPLPKLKPLVLMLKLPLALTNEKCNCT